MDDNLYKKMNESSTSDSENDFDKKSRHKHGKPVNAPHSSHYISDKDSDNTYVGTKDD